MLKSDPERSAYTKNVPQNLQNNISIGLTIKVVHWYTDVHLHTDLHKRHSGVRVYMPMYPCSVTGIIKGIIVRHFEEWFSHPITDNGGVLTIGYRYTNLHMSESYNSPGSPYWSLKAFILLALPGNHPFWQAEPLPFPLFDQYQTVLQSEA